MSYQPEESSATALQITAAGIAAWTAPGSGGPWSLTGTNITIADNGFLFGGPVYLESADIDTGAAELITSDNG